MAANKKKRPGDQAIEILDEQQTSRHSGLTLRAFIIGALGVVFVVLWTPYNNYVLFSTLFVGNHLPIGIVCLLMVLVAVNGLVKLVREGAHLSTSELIVIWSMMTVSAALPGAGLLRYWPSAVVMPWWMHYEGRPHWKPIIDALAKSPQLFPTTRVINPATGLTTPIIDNFMAVDSHSSVPWDAWIGPIIHWSWLFVGLFGFYLCLCFLMRQQWVHNEHVSFPIIQMTIEMVREPDKGRMFNSLLRNKRMWAAAALPVVLQLLAGLNAYYPTVPAPKLKWNVSALFNTHPWNAASGALYNGQIYLSVIAIAMLVPSDVAFSIWFFFLLLGAERIFLAWINVPTWPHRRTSMEIGASFAFALTLLWSGRTYLRRAFGSAFRALLGSAHRRSMAPGAWAALGTLATALATWLWFWRYGMGPIWGLVFLAGVTVMVLLVARAVNEAGMVHVETGWTTMDPMVGLFGVHTVGLRAASMAALFTVPLGHDMGESLLPHAMHNQRLSASSKRLKVKHLALAMFLALFIGLAVGIPGHLMETYHFGMFREDGWGTTGANNSYLGSVATYYKQPISRPRFVFHFFVGAVVTAFLGVMRRRSAGFPFHPIGFILADGYPVGRLWLSMLLGWGIKTMILRYGGAKTYQRLKPAIYGLILGDYFMGGVWIIVNAIVYWSGSPPKGIYLLPT